MKLKPKEAKKIAEDPIKTAKLVNLVYVTEDKLTIHRRRHGRGFVYHQDGKKITDTDCLKRFKSLVIPPAWEAVRISPLPNSHLQVLGKDSKGRTQYRYHSLWNQIRNNTKFFKMSAFGEQLPKIREHVSKDLRAKSMTRRKCIALVIRLMEETHIRIGNDYYAKTNQSYGLSTLRNKHLKEKENEIVFNFKGKKGVNHAVKLSDKRLQKLVMQCKEIPGWELFQYYDEEGNHHAIDSGMVNEYIQEVIGDTYSAKDFRVWAASKIFLETIASFDPAETKKDIEQNIVEACNISAKELGNTRSVCRSYYMHPALISKYQEGKLQRYTSQIDRKS